MTHYKSKNPFERFLNLFTEVHAGEGTSAILLCFNVFLILMAYYIIKPVREALILAGAGAEVKSYLSAGLAILLLGAVRIYSTLASRFPRKRLINSVSIFFAACLGILYVLGQLKVPLDITFFLWIGIFNLMVIAQFWGFANDLYTPEEGKRLFVIVAFGASSGAVLGGIVSRSIIGWLGIYPPMIISSAILLISLVLTNLVDTRETKGTTKKVTPAAEPLKKEGAFKLVFQNKYLLLIALLILILNWVNTTGEYILSRTVKASAEQAAAEPDVIKEANRTAEEKLRLELNQNINTSDGIQKSNLENLEHKKREYSLEYINSFIEDFIGQFYALFFTVVNLVGLFIQLFIVSRILKYLGIRIAILILPIIALGGYFIIAFFPILSIVRWVKTTENATDYSLQNTIRQTLFLPTTREQKYKAKQAIDTFFWRTGDVLAAVVVYVGSTWLSFQIKQFALFNLALVIIWIILAVMIGAENKKLTTVYENE